MIANGICEATGEVPKIARNGTWTIEASGIQWALLGIGQVRIGGQLAARLDEDPDEVDVESLARMEGARDVDVVIGIGVGGVRKERDEDRPDDQRVREKQQGGPHGRCSLAPGIRPSDRYEIGHLRARRVPPVDGPDGRLA